MIGALRERSRYAPFYNAFAYPFTGINLKNNISPSGEINGVELIADFGSGANAYVGAELGAYFRAELKSYLRPFKSTGVR